MVSKLQRRVDAKICLSLTYALHDREEVLKTKLLFPLSMNQQHAVTSNNSSCVWVPAEGKKNSLKLKMQVHLLERPRRLQSTAPLNTLLKYLWAQWPQLWQATLAWDERSTLKSPDGQREPTLSCPWGYKALLVQEFKTAALDSVAHVVSQPLNL